jgi:hypothetical protein
MYYGALGTTKTYPKMEFLKLSGSPGIDFKELIPPAYVT